MDTWHLVIQGFGIVREPVIQASMMLGDTAFIVIFTAALVIGASFLFKEQKKLAFVLMTVIIGLFLGICFKSFIQEERPCEESPGKIPCPQGFSLPSLHSLLGFTIAIGAIGNRSFAIFFPYALFIAFSRVYLGVHTVPEVAAGFALAFFACVLAEILWKFAGWKIPYEVCIRHDIGSLHR